MNMRTTTLCTLASLFILTVAPTCYSQSVAKDQTAVEPRWTELPHTDTEFVPRRYDSLDVWQKRREHLRRQILWAAGLWPIPEKTPLRARIFGRIEHDDYTLEKVYFESVPGLFVTGNLYRPRETSPHSHPGVLNPHGHAKTGRLHDDEIASYQARCITFARMGCVAFMWDMIEYNDSAMQLQGQYQEQNYWNVHNTPWKHERNRRTLWNVNALGIQLWNSIRALDFLSSLPEVDRQRLACTGESGGGTQTFMLAAVDDRVKVAAPVCMVSSYMQGGCNCENAPALRIDTHNTEFAAVMAPRSMMLVSVTGDWTSHTPEVELPTIKSIYELYGSEGKLAHAHFDTGHGYNLDMRNAVYPWFARWLSLPVSENFSEPSYSVEDVDDLLVFNESVPDHAIRDHGTLIERLIDSAKRRLDRYKPVTAEQLTEDHRIFGEGLRLSVGASVFDKNNVSYEREGDYELNGVQAEHGVIFGGQRNVRIPVWVFRPEHQSRSSVCALLVHGEGRAALAEKLDLLSGLLSDGQTVYVIEPFGIGDARADDDLVEQRGTTRYFTTFNRTNDAERVYDILAAIAYCQWHGKDGKKSKRVNIAGFGKAGPWVAIAGSVIGPTKEKDIKLRFVIDANCFDTSSEEEYLKSLFIPGVLRAGGLPNATALITPRALFLHNTSDRFDTSMVKAACALKQAEGKLIEIKIDSTACGDANLLAFMTRENVILQ